MMKERPIPFSDQMVRAILDGRKTQTRRIVKPQPNNMENRLRQLSVISDCPYGKIGDRLWVKEPHTDIPDWDISSGTPEPIVGWMYKADFDYVYSPPGGWTKSIFMPRRAARILLEITNIQVERLQDISEEDAMAEGVDISHLMDDGGFLKTANPPYRTAFAGLWNKSNGKKHPWSGNPWLWVIEFKRIKP